MHVPQGSARSPNVIERVAGRYDLVRRIGEGGMGEVFVARELLTGRQLALKRLLPGRRKRQTSFRAEYHTLARLKHPYIIEVYEFGVDNGLPYFTMELLDGQDLEGCPAVGMQESCRIVRDVACSLALLHSQKLLHRDVSPRNVQRTSAHVCKLIDFGTMMPFGVAPNLAGTAPFISPEAWEGAVLDQRADLYSLGALAYWLLSRQLPTSARGLDRGPAPYETPAPLRSVAADIPQELAELVMSMLEFDPNRRPSSAAEVVARLSGLAGLRAEDMPLLARSHLGSSSFIGHEPLLDSADDALRLALLRNGGAVLVAGDEGAGKTRVLQEVSLAGQTKGFSVVRAFASRPATGAHVARELYRSLRRAAPQAFDLLSPSERSVLSSFDWRESLPCVAEPAETRARLQWALSAYFRAVSATGPWLVLVDDLDLADEFSVAFLTALSAMAETLPLLIVATCGKYQRRHESCSLTAFGKRARAWSLSDLDEDATRTLVTNLFGRVPNCERLLGFLYREAHGNPALTMELCTGLLERGVIRYLDGSFVLPESEIREEPADSARALALRLEGLSPVARDLAELIAMCRGSVSLELCLSACQASGDEILSGVQELVSRSILMSSGRDYIFAQEALRRSVSHSLGQSRELALHSLLARAYLAVEHNGPLWKLEAAWHLVHTERELEGARVLYEVTPALVESGVAYHGAIRGLEKALEVFERRQVSLETSLAIRALLARASYLYDYRLAQRYAKDTIDKLTDWCGLSFVYRWERFLRGDAALLVCLALMTFRRLFRSRAERGPTPRLALKYLGQSVVATIGVHVTALDGKAAQAQLRSFRIFRGRSSFSLASAVYQVAEAICLQPLGREAEFRALLDNAKKAIDKLRPHHLAEAERRNLRVGVMFSGAVNECYRAGSKALDHADALEAEGTRLACAAAHRIRFTYYAVRGMREKAEEFRQELDIQGIQGGTTWQVDWYTVPAEGMASALFGDLVGTGRALERLEDLTATISSMMPMRDMVRVGYHLCRGEYALACELGERFVATYPPRTVPGWGAAYATYAAALNHSGRHQEAEALCKRALATLSAGEDKEYIILYGPLARELANARIGLGDHRQARLTSDQYVALLEATGEHALLTLAFRTRVAMARAAKDQALLADALVAMRSAAELTGSSSLIALAARAAQANLRACSVSDRGFEPMAPPVSDDEVPPSQSMPVDGASQRRRGVLH